jgi:DNA-binding transcriptional ArsR family regulator
MCSTRAPSYRTLASLSRIILLDVLQQRGAMDIVDLATAAGLHHNTAREHLHRLIAAGFVTCEPEPRHSKGRPRMLYSAARGADHKAGSIREEKVAVAVRHGEQVRHLLPIEPSPCRPSSSLTRQLDALDEPLEEKVAVMPTDLALVGEVSRQDDQLRAKTNLDGKIATFHSEVTYPLASKAKPDAILLHSLPRMDEIPTDVDITRWSRYWQEAFNGVVMRMALLALVLGAME